MKLRWKSTSHYLLFNEWTCIFFQLNIFEDNLILEHDLTTFDHVVGLWYWSTAGHWRAHHLHRNYNTASVISASVHTQKCLTLTTPHWHHKDWKMTSQWNVRTFVGFAREVSSHNMMQMHSGHGKPRFFPVSWLAVSPTRPYQPFLIQATLKYE